MNLELERVLRKMCQSVNADYDSIDFKKKSWFWDYEWTQEEENEFVNWLANELYHDKSLLRKFAYIPIKTKEHCRRIAEGFVNNYGWRIK